MHRFFLSAGEGQGIELTLTGAEAHHAADVLRVRPGERISILDGAGREFLCEIVEAARKKVRTRVVEKKTAPSSPFSVTLLQAVPKGKLMEGIIQKATELGAARIVPLLTERVVMHLDDEGAAQKAEKWRQTAIEAIKQCGTPWLPRIEEPLSLAAFMARKETFELALVGSLQSGARHPRQCFEEFRARHQRSPTTLAWWIGPEGDFTLEELALIRSTGAQPVSFGSNVLRCETAATYALSIVNYELGDPGSALEEKN